MLRLLLILSLFTINAFAKDYKNFEIDNDEMNSKYKIKLKSGKRKSVRFYQALREKTFNQPIEYVLKSITNFEEKCNNDYKDRRELLDKKKNCAHHNGNLVESKIFRKLKPYKKAENEVDRFLIARRIYNRQEFSHVDQAQIFDYKNEKGQRVMIVRLQMLSDKNVKKYMKPPVEKDSVFLTAYSDFKLTEIAKGQTKLEYNYSSETDHWLLNKSVSVGKVFDGMAKSIDKLFYSITKELAKFDTKDVIKSTAVAVKAKK